MEDFSRRDVVKVAAAAGVVALGASTAAAQQQKKEGRPVSGIQPATHTRRTQTAIVSDEPTIATANGEFKAALRKLATDGPYRDAVFADPKQLNRDFKLGLQDYEALRNAAVLSGFAATKFDDLLGVSGAVVIGEQCCCCCCCCGDTGVEIYFG